MNSYEFVFIDYNAYYNLRAAQIVKIGNSRDDSSVKLFMLLSVYRPIVVLYMCNACVYCHQVSTLYHVLLI